MQPKNKALNITAKENKELTKNQKAFNRLTKLIESLSIKIGQETSKLDNIANHYLKSMNGLDEKLAREKIKLAVLLSDATKQIKFTNGQTETIRSVILFLFDSALAVITPDETEEAVFDKWSNVSYKEELQNEAEEMKTFMADQLKFMHGIDLDFSEFEDTPEGFVKFQEKLREEMSKKEEEELNTFSKKKKTKKQLEKETVKKEEEALQLKNIRSIYIALAKVLHPDTNSELENAKKEELMKRVTKAYSEKDLPALLKLELEWASTEHNHIDSISDDKLKLYINSLKNRQKELQQEFNALYAHPKYQQIIPFAYRTEKGAITAISREKNLLLKNLKGIQSDYSYLENNLTKKAIATFTLNIEKALNSKNDFFDQIPDDLLDSFEELFNNKRR